MKYFILCLSLLTISAISNSAISPDDQTYWMRVKAASPQERTEISNTGAVIEYANKDYVTVYAKPWEKAAIDELGRTEVSFLMTADLMDFPSEDEQFHNYDELLANMQELENKSAGILSLTVAGKTLEGRDIHMMTITGTKNKDRTAEIPAVLFVGTHHAREHLSTELPIKLAEHLVQQYNNKDPRIMNLVDSRVIYIVPLLNADGSEYDISSGNYKMWRKNRRKNADGTWGVDLNRNYGYKWGQEGSSASGGSETFRGAAPFSEPETQVMKNFIESHANITTLLSFHTYSELVLYPWGYTFDPITKADDRKVFETMGKKMASWNGYTPQTSADLYLVSGEMTDWAYGEHGIFAFTFELDPKDMWGGGGFYPGQAVIEPVFKKNLEPCLYLIEYAADPYRVLQSKSQQMGLKSALF